MTFGYKDYADASKTKAMTLDGAEFLRRWVQHVLPRRVREGPPLRAVGQPAPGGEVGPVPPVTGGVGGRTGGARVGRRAGRSVPALASLTKLTFLSLRGTKITDDGLKHLAPFTELTTLSLCNTRVTDQGLKEVARFKKLTDLDLVAAQVSDAGVEELKKTLQTCRVKWR